MKAHENLKLYKEDKLNLKEMWNINLYKSRIS